MPAQSRTFDPQIGPLLKTIIAHPGRIRLLANETEQETLELNSYEFLIDTGADTTCISKEIVDSLGLSPLGKVPMITPNGLSDANTYLVDITISFGSINFTCEGQRVIEYNGSTKNYNGLIGRDIICQGVFNISFDKRYIFAL